MPVPSHIRCIRALFKHLESTSAPQTRIKGQDSLPCSHSLSERETVLQKPLLSLSYLFLHMRTFLKATKSCVGKSLTGSAGSNV